MMEDAPRRWWRLSSRLVLIGFLAVGTFFLITEHRAHTLGALPFLLMLVCPLMHLFHRHDGHDGHGRSRDPEERHRH